MQKNQEKKEYTILQLMEVLSEKSDDSQLSEEFWNENRAEADELAARLKITPLQAVLFSICLRRGPRGVDFDDFARHKNNEAPEQPVRISIAATTTSQYTLKVSISKSYAHSYHIKMF